MSKYLDFELNAVNVPAISELLPEGYFVHVNECNDVELNIEFRTNIGFIEVCCNPHIMLWSEMSQMKHIGHLLEGVFEQMIADLKAYYEGLA